MYPQLKALNLYEAIYIYTLAISWEYSNLLANCLDFFRYVKEDVCSSITIHGTDFTQ